MFGWFMGLQRPTNQKEITHSWYCSWYWFFVCLLVCLFMVLCLVGLLFSHCRVSTFNLFSYMFVYILGTFSSTSFLCGCLKGYQCQRALPPHSPLSTFLSRLPLHSVILFCFSHLLLYNTTFSPPFIDGSPPLLWAFTSCLKYMGIANETHKS